MSKKDYYDFLASEPKASGEYFITFDHPKSSTGLAEFSIRRIDENKPFYTADYIIEDNNDIRLKTSDGKLTISQKQKGLNETTQIPLYSNFPIDYFLQLLTSSQWPVVGYL